MSTINNTIGLNIEVIRENDDSFSISLELPGVEGDGRFLDGISEGQIFDPHDAVAEVVAAVTEWINGAITAIERPMEFERSVA
ncbi:MAG TPA: hypothetical protein VFU07_07860 [Candidatus Lumbricidophila sp.]|nr:hypothetical protein [Candidatus Lumbricidophila sp.]